LAMFGHVWPCLAMFGHVWPCLAMFGHVWPCLAMFGHVWPCFYFLAQGLSQLTGLGLGCLRIEQGLLRWHKA